MIHYSVQPRDQIFVKCYGFFSFTENMGKNIGNNVIKNLSHKNSHKLLDHAKHYAADAFKTNSVRVIKKRRRSNRSNC